MATPPSSSGGVANGATVSAAEITQLTGVGRERLRTWERRHGFPSPLRTPSNARAYAVDDVRRVVAVRRLVESGVPLEEAVARALELDLLGPGTVDLGPLLDALPSPALAVSGVDPVGVVWTNARTRLAADAPRNGDLLLEHPSGFSSRGAGSALNELLRGDGPLTVVLEHPAWTGSGKIVRSLAWQLGIGEPGAPLVILIQLPEPPARDPLVEPIAGSIDWVHVARNARIALQRRSGLVALSVALNEVMRLSRAIDAFVLTRSGETLASARSLRGKIGGITVDHSNGAAPLRAVAEGEVFWIGAPALAALGVEPATAQAGMVIPIQAAGHQVGGVLLLFDAECPLDRTARELLQSLATAFGLVLTRERPPA